MLFTEVGITAIGAMAELVRLRGELSPKQQIKILDLKSLPFFGATAYIVNNSSLTKLSRLVTVEQFDVPFDLLLRKMIHDGVLRALVTFPFLTSGSEHALNSSLRPISAESADLIWDVFKRMIWIEGDSFDPTPLLDQICESIDERSSAYGRLWAAMIDHGFRLK